MPENGNIDSLTPKEFEFIVNIIFCDLPLPSAISKPQDSARLERSAVCDRSSNKFGNCIIIDKHRSLRSIRLHAA